MTNTALEVIQERKIERDNVIQLSNYRTRKVSTDNIIPEGYTTGTIFRKDRSLKNNIKRFFIVFCRDNIFPYLSSQEDSKYYLIKDRRGI